MLFWSQGCRDLFTFERLWPLTSLLQETEVGANPVQVDVGDFDEAIDIVEEDVEDSESTLCITHAV